MIVILPQFSCCHDYTLLCPNTSPYNHKIVHRTPPCRRPIYGKMQSLLLYLHSVVIQLHKCRKITGQFTILQISAEKLMNDGWLASLNMRTYLLAPDTLSAVSAFDLPDFRHSRPGGCWNPQSLLLSASTHTWLFQFIILAGNSHSWSGLFLSHLKGSCTSLPARMICRPMGKAQHEPHMFRV